MCRASPSAPRPSSCTPSNVYGDTDQCAERRRLDRSCVHDVLPIPSEDEIRAQTQIIALKRTLRRMESTLKQNYLDSVESKSGQTQDYLEVMKVLGQHPLYQSYKVLGEQAQQLMWTLVMQTVNRELERISVEAEKLMVVQGFQTFYALPSFEDGDDEARQQDFVQM